MVNEQCAANARQMQDACVATSVVQPPRLEATLCARIANTRAPANAACRNTEPERACVHDTHHPMMTSCCRTQHDARACISIAIGMIANASKSTTYPHGQHGQRIQQHECLE